MSLNEKSSFISSKCAPVLKIIEEITAKHIQPAKQELQLEGMTPR